MRGRGRHALIAVLLVMPVAFGIHDLATSGTLSQLGQNLVDGVANGAIWSLIAMAYTLVYGIIGLINLAQGDLFMIGSFVSFSLYGTLGLTLATGVLGLIAGLLLTLVLAVLACGSLHVLMERVGYRPLRHAPRAAPLLVSLGFSFILQNVGFAWAGAFPRGVPDLIDTSHELLSVAGISITNGDVIAIAIAAPVVVLLLAFVRRTRSGMALRATAEDREAARLMGINVDTAISITFFLAGLLAAAAGLIYNLFDTSLWYFQGFTAGLIGFTAAVMGGLGSLSGAVLGGLVIGFIQQISDNRIGADWTPALVFAYLILILVFAPQGLLGEAPEEAA